MWKKSRYLSGPANGGNVKTYYYLRDAQGNVMANYQQYTAEEEILFVATEHPMYGSSRIGVDNRIDTLYKNGTYSPEWFSNNISIRDLGLKSFELSNHLGNVLVTVSDKKVYTFNGTDIIFEAEITTISDYYPFGSAINTRSYTASTKYRYGFNTQEKDDEIAGEGNSYTAEFWQYDGRLGRRFNVDPLSKKFTHVSTYSVFFNSPVLFVDISGDAPETNSSEDPKPQKHDNSFPLDNRGIERMITLMTIVSSGSTSGTLTQGYQTSPTRNVSGNGMPYNKLDGTTQLVQLSSSTCIYGSSYSNSKLVFSETTNKNGIITSITEVQSNMIYTIDEKNNTATVREETMTTTITLNDKNEVESVVQHLVVETTTYEITDNAYSTDKQRSDFDNKMNNEALVGYNKKIVKTTSTNYTESKKYDYLKYGITEAFSDRLLAAIVLNYTKNETNKAIKEKEIREKSRKLMKILYKLSRKSLII